MLQAVAEYFPEGSKLPVVLEQLLEQYKSFSTPQAAETVEPLSHAVKVAAAGLAAYGLMVQFLKDNMLDKALLPNARYDELCDAVSAAELL